MAKRVDKTTGGLSIRARLALFHDSSVNAETACSIEEQEITYDLMMRSGVKALNLQTAGIGPTRLKTMGVESAMQMRQLGFDALHLCDADFANEATMAFGSEAVRSAFLASAADAVALAGSEAMHILNVTVLELLTVCAGYPGEAKAVLQQLPQGNALHDISCSVVLDAGLRHDSLRQCGYGMAGVIQQISPTGPELVKLGFTC